MKKKYLVSDQEIALEDILAEFPGHLYWKDCDGHYLGANLEQAKSLGFHSAREIIDKTDADLIWGEQATELRRMDEEIMASGKPYVLEESVTTSEGKGRTYISKKAPLHNLDGVVVGIIGTSIDITAQKDIEEALRNEKLKAEQASQVKSEFIANMSHDLRTPLSGIQSLAEDILGKTNDASIAQDATYLLEASGDLLVLIDAILNVVRIDSASEDSTSQVFNLQKLINNSVNIMMPKVLEKAINFELHYATDLPITIIGQHLLLQRVIMNLLSNALKFTEPKGNVSLAVELLETNESSCRIRIEVKDTGIGIPSDKLDFIFEKFNRLSASFREQHKGTGVGLYMVKRYVEQMEGRVNVQSREQEGTTFCVDIPFTLSEQTPPVACATDANDPLAQQKSYAGTNILIVEDNVIAQRSQGSKFTQLDCDVKIADTAKKAIQLFKEYRFDLLILDVGLPDMAGWALAQRFRNS
ncbi:MAG: hypothetical protein COB66_04830, partial [Coxiella sp. (in: Bacteria)]